MQYIELLKAPHVNFKIKFINLLKDESKVDIKTLSHMYDNLLDSKKFKIELNNNDSESLSKIVLELMELDIHIGDSSFHEEDNLF